MIGEILKKYREKKDVTQQFIADELGISLRTYQYYEEGRSEPKRTRLKQLSELLGFDMAEAYEQFDWGKLPSDAVAQSKTPETVYWGRYLTDEQKIEAEKNFVAGETKVKVPYVESRREHKQTTEKKKKNVVPFFDADATGSMSETEMSPIHAPAGTIDIGDLLHDSQAAIRIYGNSMLPNYPPGCVVGLVKMRRPFIQPGEVYVIETRDGRMLKRLFYKEDSSKADTLMCYSDNIMKFEGGAREGKLAYPPFEIPRSEIVNLFIVTGVIKRNTNSIVINR